MNVMFLTDAVGSLPYQATFNAPIDGPVAFFLSGSMYSTADNTEVGIDIYLDTTDNFLGRIAVYCTKDKTHQAGVPLMTSALLTLGEHTIIAQATNPQTGYDEYDFLYVQLLY